MKNSTNNYILTGVTGILGSHILYELMMAVANNNYEGQIVLLLRAKKDATIEQRFDELFREELVPGYLRGIDVQRIRENNITLVDFDLKYFKDTDIVNHLGEGRYHLIHCAASVNLGTNAYAFDEIRHNNYLGTLNLIHALHTKLCKVSYVSTAFSLTGKDGNIYENNAYRNDEDFRNHYERFKVQTEQEVVQVCEAYELAWQIFRPSIICGRLVDYPYHVIPRFLVFYLFSAFFFRAREAYGEQPVRIKMDTTSALNLIPVDYAAKAIVRALATDIKELNIVSRKGVPNTFTIPEMFRQLNWNNYQFTDQVPKDMSPMEKLYYRTVGPQLNNYLSTPEMPGAEFNVSILSELMKDVGEPNVAESFPQLLRYAFDRRFNNLLA